MLYDKTEFKDKKLRPFGEPQVLTLKTDQVHSGTVIRDITIVRATKSILIDLPYFKQQMMGYDHLIGTTIKTFLMTDPID